MEFLIDKLFIENKDIVTEVTLKYGVDCQGVNLKALPFHINSLNLYPTVRCYYNGYGVLTFSFLISPPPNLIYLNKSNLTRQQGIKTTDLSN